MTMTDNPEINIRQAAIYDIPVIARLEQDTSASPWSADSIKHDITANKNAYVAVIELGKTDAANGILGDVIGYADMWTVAGEAQLNNIAIDPDHRGRHYGKKLLDHMIEKCRDLACDLMTLEVRRSNTIALQLYGKMGFEAVGVRPRYYKDNNEDAILMNKIIRDVEVEYSIDIDVDVEKR